jgi:hypothetical protein
MDAVMRDATNGPRSLLVDTVPKNARNRGAINLGLEIVRKLWAADVCHWTDTVDAGRYDRIGFNVFYATHMLNVYPFLRRHGIEKGSGPQLVAGGPGIGWRGALSGIVDAVHEGEADPECRRQIVSEPLIKDGKAVVELSRGCRHNCAFCEYSHNNRIRFKPIALAKEQIDAVMDRGCKRVNFMSTDFGGYPHLDDLMEHCLVRGVRVLNGDYCVTSVANVIKWLPHLPRQMKLGIETFHEPTRAAVQKGFSDDLLESVIVEILEVASSLHFYLIYGLPGDNYSAWFEWLARLVGIRKSRHTSETRDIFGKLQTTNTKNIRFEFNITNFEPCDGTPLADAPLVDFEAKDAFLEEWSTHMVRLGLFKGAHMGYANSVGRLGRKEESYRMLMELKRGGPELADKLKYALPNGVGRSISPKAATKFLSYGDPEE